MNLGAQTKYITILLVSAITLVCCKKNFLTLYPAGQLNEGNFYKTASDFQQALTGAYAPLRDAANIAFYMEEMRSDNTKYDYNSKDRGGSRYEQLADFMDDASNSTISSLWAADYTGIQRVDVILDRIQTIGPEIPDSVKRQITGEAKALRGHYYFELVRCFGALPLYLHEVTNNVSAFVSRSSVDSVYAQIIADFTDAMGLLSPPSSFPQTGRVTKGMAATELGLVYLTRKDYVMAGDILQMVTQMGYELLPDYADVFTIVNKNSRESVFEVQYKSGMDGQQSCFVYRFIPATPHTMNILGVDYNNGQGTSNSPSGGWNVPTDDLISAYEPNDKRLDASIAVAKGKFNSNVDFIPDSVVSILSPATPGEISKKFAKKQYHLPYGLQNNTDDNWPLYRYSDVLLMLAEALNEQGKSADALFYLNQVRARAGLVASGETDRTALSAVIEHERRVELAFENHRWFDLVRTGQAIPVMTALGILQRQKYAYLLPASYTITQNRLIYAIPFREIQVNPDLIQNDGY